MKRKFSLVFAVLFSAIAVLSGCNASGGAPSTPSGAASGQPESSAAQEAAFEPSRNIDWFVTSSPGGGSDIYTRMISDIMTKEGLVSETILVTNKTDGGGEVGRAQVASTKGGKQADHTLLTFNSGDLMPMVLNTPNRVENFTPIAIMAVDKQLLFAGPKSKYADFKSAIETAKSGTPVVIGGSKGDDIATYEALIKELGLTSDQMSYITYDSTGDAITAILGGHVDLCISKPAAASQYVEEGVDASKKLTPILALSTERYTGNLADAPTLKEVGDYNDVEVPIWRGVVGPKEMSPEAAKFWSEQLQKVSESQTWQTDYIEKNKLISSFMGYEQAKTFMEEYQKNYMAAEGIQ